MRGKMKEGFMEKGNEKKVRWKLIVAIIVVIAAIIAGICYWYFQIKKPYDMAVNNFNAAAKNVTEQNKELDAAIESAQAVLDSEDQPYDTNTSTDAITAISDAEAAKREVPEIPDKTDDINAETDKLSEPLDYSSAITNINDKKAALENSIQQMKQITNPSEDFVIQRLQGIDGISGYQAVTEDHDPNGNLNKQGGYTAAVYFSSPWINQDEVYGNDIVDKGTDCGGCIEVYSSAEDAESRNTYLASFDSAGFLNPGSHTVLGTIVIRTASDLTATQQNDLTQRISDKLLELQ